MSSMEKLFIQIFERKNWIIDQLRQQADLYNQHLASKLLIEGVTPPSWLWDPKPLSNRIDPRELNKEEMISKLLFSHPNLGFPSSSGLSSLHHRLDVSGENIPLPEVLSSKVHVPEKSMGNIQRELGFSPVLDMTPQEKINLSNPNSCMWADKSLVQVQRSKSRQRSFEVRSASKRAEEKSSTSQEDGELQENLGFAPVLDMTPQQKINLNNPDSCMWADKSLVQVPLSKSRQRSFEVRSVSKRAADKSSTSQEKDSELQENVGFSPVLDMTPQEKINLSNPDSCMLADKSFVQVQRSKSRQRSFEVRSASKRAADKSSTSQEKDSELQENLGFAPVLDMSAQEKINLSNPDSMRADKSLFHGQRSKSRQRALELRSASKRAADKSSTTTSQEKDSELQSLETCSSMAYSGRVTLSKFSRDLLNHEEESVELKDSFKISKKVDNKTVDSTSVCSGKDIFEHLSPLDLGVNKRHKLRSGPCEKSPIVNSAMMNEYQKLSSGQISSSVDKYALDEENQSVDVVVYEPCQQQKNGRNFELNSTGLVVASENLGLNVSSDCSFNMIPKALNSCDVGGPFVDKQSLDILVGISAEKPSEAREITSVANYDTCHLEGRSLELEASNKVDEFRESISKTHVDMHAEPGMEKSKSGMKENLESNFYGTYVSVPNMQHPPSDGMTSLSTNADLSKIASPLLGNEMLDTAVDKINILLETDNRSPEQSNFDMNTPESNMVGISVTAPRILYDPVSFGENKMVIDDGSDLKMPQSINNHLTEGVQKHLCGEMRLDAPTSDSCNYKGGCCVEKQILSPQKDSLNKKMTGPISREIMMQENFNLPEIDLVNGKDGYLVPSSSQMEDCVKSSFRRGVMLTNNSYPQLKRRKIEGEKKRTLSVSSNVLKKKIQNVMQDPVNVDTSLEVSSPCQSLHVSLEAKTTHLELDGMHHELISHLTAGSEPPTVLQDEMGTREGDTDIDASSVIRMDSLGLSKFNTQSYSDSKHGAFSYKEVEDPASLAFDVRKSCNVDTGSVPHVEHVANVDNIINLSYLNGPLQELKDPLEAYGVQPCSSAAYTDKKDPASVGSDCIMPEFEGFTIESETENDQLHLDIDLQNTVIERASFLEQLCISSSMCTPLPQRSTTFMLPETSDYQSVPNGLLEKMNFGSSLLENVDISMQNKASLSCTQEEKNKNQEPAFSQCFTFSDYQFGWSSKRSCLPSVGNLWDQMDLIPSKSSSSGKNRSSNPELTCFRIEEDPWDYNEESENADGISKQFEENSISELMNSGYKRDALLEITESQLHGLGQITAEEDRCHDRNSLCSEPSFTGNQKMVRQNHTNRYNKKHPSEGKENCTLSIEVNRKKKAESSYKRRSSKPKLSIKGSERQGGHRLFEKQSKQKNIVSNITSFLPLVQQKQAAAVCAGKKDIKVRALKAAEAAKRLEEKRKNERNMKKEALKLELEEKRKNELNMKKEALKLEQERLAREHMKQTELLRKKKEEEHKKKDADIAAKKRRKEEEKMAKERKRKRVEEPRQQLEEPEVKLRARRGDKDIRPTIDGKMNNPESNNRLLGNQKMEKCIDHEALSKPFDALGVIDDSVGTPRSDRKAPEKSYEISPYLNSDIESEDNVAPMTKFIPTWARKNSEDIALFLKSKIDPDVIFPSESFSSHSSFNKTKV